MVGDYSAEMAMFETGHIIDPPTNTWCEKNWIPLDKSIDFGSTNVGKGSTNVGFGASLDQFIYRWAPF